MVMQRSARLIALPAAILMLAGCSTAGTKSSTVNGSSGGSASSSTNAGSLSVSEILAKVKQNVQSADNLHVKGNAVDAGQKIGLDISYKGKDSFGTVTVSGNDLTLLTSGGASYFKASDEFWRAAAAANADTIISVIKGRWIKVAPTDTQFADLAALGDRTKLADDALTPDSLPTKGKDATVNGVDCLTLGIVNKSALYVEKSTLRPIQLHSTDSGVGDLAFTYDAVTIPPAPTGAQVMTTKQLAGG